MRHLKFLGVCLCGVLFITLATVQLGQAAEKTVKLTVQGCSWPGNAARVSYALLEIDGVVFVQTDYKTRTAIVVFDDEKTNIEAMEKVLADKDFHVTGEPEFLENYLEGD